MSFGTTYYTPAPLGRDLDFAHPGPRQTFHQRSCSGSAYTEDFFLQKTDKDLQESKDSTPTDSGAYLHVDRAGPGPKQPKDRMKLNRILNDGSVAKDNLDQSYGTYAYPDGSQSFQSLQPSGAMSVAGFPLSPCSPTDGSPVAAEMQPTLATMASPVSPLTSFSTMGQSSVVFDDSMAPYGYQMNPYHSHPYTFKHAGHADAHDHSPQTHLYSQSPDPSAGSPTVLSTFPQRPMNSLVDPSYGVPDSPPSYFYHQQAPAPYNMGSHSPISHTNYASAYDVPGPNTLALTPPMTPHYGFAQTLDPHHYTPMYGEATFTLPSQGPRSHRTVGPTSSSKARKTPYEPRAARTSDGANPAPRRFGCNECEKAFPTKGELASHARCHLKVPAFLCGICGRPFKRRTDYVRHVRNVHEEVGRYSCDQCGERFGRLDKLKRHDKRGCGADKEDEDEK